MTTAEAMAARWPSPPRAGGGVRGTRAASRNRPRACPRGGHGGAASAGGPPTSLSRIRRSAAPAAGAPPLHLERTGQGPLSGGFELRHAGEMTGPGASIAAAHTGGSASQQRVGTALAAASSSLRASSLCPPGLRSCGTASGGRCRAVQQHWAERRSGRRKEERERADGWAQFLQGKRNPFICCGVLETKTECVVHKITI